jgi:hypothetical protein
MSEPRTSRPFLLRWGIIGARALAAVSLLMIACHPTGRLTVRVNGRVLERGLVLTQIFPAMLAFSVLLLVIAAGLSNARPWARPLTVAFWVILTAVLAWIGGRSQLANTLATTIPIAGAALGYLYFNPSVQSYFATRARRDATAADLESWLDRPKRPGPGA